MRLPRLLTNIVDPDSRKVGFGWTLFIVSTILLVKAKIDASAWQLMVSGSGVLIGGGTVADAWLKGKKKEGGEDAKPSVGA